MFSLFCTQYCIAVALSCKCYRTDVRNDDRIKIFKTKKKVTQNEEGLQPERSQTASPGPPKTQKEGEEEASLTAFLQLSQERSRGIENGSFIGHGGDAGRRP
jgi:hypothetical protein